VSLPVGVSLFRGQNISRHRLTAKDRDQGCELARVTADLAESNGSLPPGL